MKVAENTPDRLRMTEFPLGLAIALSCVIVLPVVMSWGYFRAGVMAGGFTLAGIALLLLIGCFSVFVKHRSVTLDRKAAQVTVVERGLLGAKRKTFSMTGLRGASVQTTIIRDRHDWPKDADTTRMGSRRKLRNVRAFRPQLVFQNGRTEPLTEIYANDTSADRTAAAINGWIGGWIGADAPNP